MDEDQLPLMLAMLSVLYVAELDIVTAGVCLGKLPLMFALCYTGIGLALAVAWMAYGLAWMIMEEVFA